jgi:hypothetical protein
VAKDRLAIYEKGQDSYGFGAWQIGWFLAEEQDFGLMLGCEKSRTRDETSAATNAILALPKGLLPRELTALEWTWDSKSAAQKALRVAKEAVRLHGGKKPMPEWAICAVAAGWKPPTG